MWALTGTLRSADILRHLDQYHAAGWGVMLYPRSGLELEYLSDAWLERVRFIVKQAAQREMEVWIYDEYNWPSGHAKGLVTQGHDELCAEWLEVEADGKNHITKVPGNANLLLPQATKRFIEVTHERYAQAVGPWFGSTIRAIFTDEPSLTGQHYTRPTGRTAWRVTWSSVMNAALGGDFRERLAAAKDPATWSGWRDYWAAYADLFHDAWVEPLAAWCRAHDVALTGHFLGEGKFGDQVAFNGSLLRQQAAQGIPGIDEILTRPELDRCEALTLASMAEHTGRERMAEVYAMGPPSMTLDTMRQMVDLGSACGIDRYVLAICPLDLRGGIEKRAYLGIFSPHQPWFRDYARAFADYVAEAAPRAHQAEPLGIEWPSDEELWAAAGPSPRTSPALGAMTKKALAQAREVLADRLGTAPVVPSVASIEVASPSLWSFEPEGPNSLRLDGPTLQIVELPDRVELSIQSQWVQSLRINGAAIDIAKAPIDERFDTSYRRMDITKMLKPGENRFETKTLEPKPLRFLPGLVLWGNFAIDAQGCLIASPKTIALGDWRTQGYPAFAGTGRYRTTATFAAPPSHMSLDTGGYPASASVNGKSLGRRAWPPMQFDLGGTAKAGQNEIVVEVTSTLGHLFVPKECPPVGLLAVRFEADS